MHHIAQIDTSQYKHFFLYIARVPTFQKVHCVINEIVLNCLKRYIVKILIVELYFLSIESPLSLVSVGIQIQIGFGILRPLQFGVGFIKTVSYCNVSSSLLILISLFFVANLEKRLMQSVEF